MSVRKEYDKSLARLDEMVLAMGRSVMEALKEALDCWEKADREGARRVMAGDDAINQDEKQIEHLCMTLLLRQQPVASDLRRVRAALRMSGDLERIGDHAQDIAELSLAMPVPSAHPDRLEKTGEMSSNALWMLEKALECWTSADTALADAVIARDDAVDKAFQELKRALASHLAGQPQEVDEIMDWLMLAKYLERIADHAVNLAEWVIFCKTGVYKDEQII